MDAKMRISQPLYNLYNLYLFYNLFPIALDQFFAMFYGIKGEMIGRSGALKTCSFCNKSEAEVGALFPGTNDSRICIHCCRDVLETAALQGSGWPITVIPRDNTLEGMSVSRFFADYVRGRPDQVVLGLLLNAYCTAAYRALEIRVAQALATELNLRFIDLDQQSWIKASVRQYFARKECECREMVPLSDRSGTRPGTTTLVVAAVDPRTCGNLRVPEGVQVRFMVATRDAIQRAITRLYPAAATVAVEGGKP